MRSALHLLHAALLLVAADPLVFKPTGIYAAKSTQPQWYLVSEDWCVNCKGPKEVFLGKGWPKDHVLTLDECEKKFGFRPDGIPYEFTPLSKSAPPAAKLPEVSRYIQPVQGRYATWQGREYDLTTWRRICSMNNCQMCAYLDQCRANYLAGLCTEAPSPQSPSPDDVVTEALAVMKLTPDDVVAELGSGNGLPAIRMARETGCRVIGVENDPVKVVESRKKIQAAGLGDRITIVEGDVLQFDPKQYGVTATYAYLYPELLTQITPQLSAGRIAVCPGHKPGGIKTEPVGQLWVRR